MMTRDDAAVSTVPVEDHDHRSGFREVIAYLRGIADTVTAQGASCRPVSLPPHSVRPAPVRALSLCPISSHPLPVGPVSVRPPSLAPWSTAPASADSGASPAFGELPFDSASLWPQVPLGPASEPTRGGARLIDPGSARPLTGVDLVAIWRRTLPYGAPMVSLAASSSSLPAGEGGLAEPAGEWGLLRCAELPREWYELTDTCGGYAD
jgi:hypothetical protein